MDVARYLARRQVEEWYKKMKEQALPRQTPSSLYRLCKAILS